VKILIMHGPSLNLLGTREPAVYGTKTLEEIDALIVEYAGERGVEVATYQTNHEGSLIDGIHAAVEQGFAAIVLNPGAYTHTSMAIADAIRAVSIPVVEVHLSNLFARGPERARSVTATAARGIVSGFGHESYLLGIDAALRLARPARAARKRTAQKPSRRRAAKRPSSAVARRTRS
jgi:3-dehydroquinate dehydratase-2